MRWIFTQEKIILYFYTLLIMSTVVLCDYYLFSILHSYYGISPILIVMSIFCGTGVLFTLNSITNTVKTVHKKTYEGIFMYPKFVSIFILIIAGTLMSVPGIITSITGLFLYTKPIRMYISKFVYVHNKPAITQLFSHFLANNIKTI